MQQPGIRLTAKSAKMRVLHNSGREDQLDKAAIERLAGSLCRLLQPGRAAALREPGLACQGSVAYGGPWLLTQLDELIKDSGKLSATKRAELRGVISTKPGLNRYLRVTPGGLLRTDAAAIKAEQNLDGKYLLRTSDSRLSAEDIALGYKQLLEVERSWPDLKQVIDLRPVYHRKEERIRAHVILCWLALLLIRVAETTTGTTWNKIADELSLLTLGTFTGQTGTFRQTAELTKSQRDLLAKLTIPHPKKIIEVTPAIS